jgi:hypothetical protein
MLALSKEPSRYFACNRLKRTGAVATLASDFQGAERRTRNCSRICSLSRSYHWPPRGDEWMMKIMSPEPGELAAPNTPAHENHQLDA